jgi:DNA-binding MarR family transcriptional regulator
MVDANRDRRTLDAVDRGSSRGRGRVAEPDVEALMRVSRVITGVIVGSLLATEAPPLTLPQLRALVLMDGGGVTSTTALAEALEVHVSSASRLVDRLVAGGMVNRAPSASDRRQTTLALTPKGRRTLATVMEHRRAHFAAILGSLDAATRAALAENLTILADAADATHEALITS